MGFWVISWAWDLCWDVWYNDGLLAWVLDFGLLVEIWMELWSVDGRVA